MAAPTKEVGIGITANCSLLIAHFAKFQFLKRLDKTNAHMAEKQGSVVFHGTLKLFYRTDLAYSVGVMPNFSLNCREK